MSQAIELKNWQNEIRCKTVVEQLTKNGFTSKFCSTKAEAIDYVIDESQMVNTIGIGGSLSLAELNLLETLKSMDKEILTPNGPGLSQEEKLSIMHRQHQCDLFLSSANSVTLGGALVFMESTGNRISSILFGPKKTILIVGRNKITQDIEDAVNRIKRFVSPPNCKRLKYKTPCTVTGSCGDCNSPDRSCRITTIIERKPKVADIHVLVINEDLGL